MLNSIPKVLQNCPKSTPKVLQKYSKSVPKVLQKYSKSAPKVPQKYSMKYSKSAPKVLRKYSKSTPKVLQKCLKSAPKVLHGVLHWFLNPILKWSDEINVREVEYCNSSDAHDSIQRLSDESNVSMDKLKLKLKFNSTA